MRQNSIPTTLVPRVAAGTLLLLIAGTYATNNNATGDFNKPLYIGILALAIAITAAFARRHRTTRADMAVALLSSCGLVWGIWTIERPQLLAFGLWEGFGYRVAIAVVVLVLLFGTMLRPQNLSRPIRTTLALVVGVCCVCDVLSAVRTLNFMPYVNNNLNEINDMLGPAVGKIPGSTFIPEYTSLYGWLFVPMKHLVSPLVMVGAMTIFLTLLGFAAVVLAVWTAKRLLGIGGLLLPVALVIPITYVTSHATGDISSIASLFQELPIRLLSGFVVVAVGLKDLVLLYRGTLRVRSLLLIGVLCGVIAWNSQDFGLAATIVYGMMILLGAAASARMRAMGVWLVGLLVGLSSYPLFLFAMGSPLDLGLVGTFVKLSASGLGSAPIQVPGPVLIVVPIIICSTAAGWALMRIRRRNGTGEDPLLDQATVGLTFVGTWSAVCLVYYVNRAYAAGQLQTMLLPCGVCIAGLLSIAIRTDAFGSLWQHSIDATVRTGLSAKVRVLPVGIFACLCFASALLTPDPITAARNLVDPPAMTGYATYDLPQVLSAVRAAQAYLSDKAGDLTYLGQSFNYVTLDAHVRSNAILFPFSLTAARTGVIQVECRYLASHHSEWMVLSLDAVAAFGSNTCGIYQRVTVRGLANGQLQELK
jgi:hypothetical protein